jgi:hypothetical protein
MIAHEIGSSDALYVGGSASTTLQQATVPTVSNSSCNSAYSSYRDISAHIICAGISSGGKDAMPGK